MRNACAVNRKIQDPLGCCEIIFMLDNPSRWVPRPFFPAPGYDNIFFLFYPRPKILVRYSITLCYCVRSVACLKVCQKSAIAKLTWSVSFLFYGPPLHGFFTISITFYFLSNVCLHIYNLYILKKENSLCVKGHT